MSAGSNAGQSPTADPRPFHLGDGTRAVCCIHGLTGTPWEVRPIGDALAAAGFLSSGPLLAGHGDVAELESSTWRDWYASAEQNLDALLEGGTRRVVVLGFSMGSLLALRLAALRPDDVAGVIAMAVPLELPGWKQTAIGALSRLRKVPVLGNLVGTHPKRGGPDIRVLEMARQNPSLREFPYPTLEQLIELQAEVRGLLGRVTSPLLLMHGRLDHAAPAEDSARVAQLVASSDVRRLVFDRSFHHLAVDLDRERVLEEVVGFCRRILGTPSTAGPAGPDQNREQDP